VAAIVEMQTLLSEKSMKPTRKMIEEAAEIVCCAKSSQSSAITQDSQLGPVL
jgi:phosphoribosyl-ATP pyrophosphohydrolase